MADSVKNHRLHRDIGLQTSQNKTMPGLRTTFEV